MRILRGKVFQLSPTGQNHRSRRQLKRTGAHEPFPVVFLSGGTDKKPPRARGYAEDDIVGGICGEGGKAGPRELKAGSNGAVR